MTGDLTVEYVDPTDLVPDPDNPRRIDDDELERLRAGIRRFGFVVPLVVNQDRRIVGGHQRHRIAVDEGIGRVPVVTVDVDDDEARTLNVLLNNAQAQGRFEPKQLVAYLEPLDADLRSLAGFSERGLAKLEAEAAYGPADGANTLRDRFVVPPFSVLDGRQGYWAARKREWLRLGIRGEEGREHLGTTVAAGALQLARGGPADGGGSVFDPVLAELAYRWYAPTGGTILDPFAGGTTRGVVAGVLGHPYTGIELRPEQVAANQAGLAATPAGVITEAPVWLEGDSAQLPAAGARTKAGTWQRHVTDGAPYDLIFTCPPYYDLEPYSADTRDGSALPTWPEFVAWYKHIFGVAASLTAPNRFAAIVVGEIRDQKTHAYRNLVGLTIDAFTEAGWAYFAEYTYITPVGSIAIRAGAQFAGNRKPAKSHQNLLVFYNGSPHNIATEWPALADTDVSLPDGPAEAG